MARPQYFSMETVKKMDIKWPAAFVILAIYISTGLNKLAPVFYYSKYNEMVVTFQKYADYFPTTYLGLDIDGDTYRIFVGVFELSAVIGFMVSEELRNTSFYILVVSALLESYSLIMLEEWPKVVFAVIKCFVCVYLANRDWFKKPVKKTMRTIALKNVKKMKSN